MRLDNLKVNSWLIKIVIGLVVILCLEIAINYFVILRKDGPTLDKKTAAEENNGETKTTEQPAEEAAANNYLPRRLDGVLVSPELANNRPLAIMIDNMIESRPAAGLSKANIVYEAVAESEITRFLAIFASGEEVEKIGPVRSARPYYLDWAEEYTPVYAHCGGSPQALTNLKKGQYDVFNLEQFIDGQYFWRDYKRYAPYNLYTSTKLLTQFLIDEEIAGEINFEPWLFKEDAMLEGRPAAGEEKNPIIHFSSNNYHKVKWVYNAENNDYLRYQKDEAHQDSDNSPIKSKNIVVQYVQTLVLDSYGRLATQTTGTGDALIFQDGAAIKGTWSKPKTGEGERTKFLDAEGNEIKFNRGTIWIEAVPTGKSVTY